MKNLYKLLLIGHATIVVNILSAVCMSLFYDVIVKYFGHAERFQWIFGVGGVLMACASIGVAILVWTNKLGDGFPEQIDYGKSGYGKDY